MAAGKGDTINDYVVSNIHEYAAKVRVYDEEGEGVNRQKGQVSREESTL